MKDFLKYNKKLSDIVDELGALDPNSPIGSELQNDIDYALNGHGNKLLKQFVSSEARRADGVYFSGSRLATSAASFLAATTDLNSRILDPMCGSGDLLLACAANLPTGSDLVDTLSKWGEVLIGYDLHPEFVKAAQTRLILSALGRHRYVHSLLPKQLNRCFPNIETGDGILESLSEATHVIFNPPYKMVPTPDWCTWTSGHVNYAALATLMILDKLSEGTEFVAILPDVLRSGTRYARWRKKLETKCQIRRIKVFGQFDHLTDVDVFILNATTISKRLEKLEARPSWKIALPENENIGMHFEVSVGAVVEFRHTHEGCEVPYIRSRELEVGAVIRQVKHTRKFSGTLAKPPFVVVRRTSRPDDKIRARATVVATSGDAAVENHLLVLRPRDARLETCISAVRVLHSEQTSNWLNKRIRCRHLTTSAVKEIPWEAKRA